MLQRLLVLLTFIGALTTWVPCSLAQSPKIYSVFPQIAIGSGWSCDVFVTNQDVRPIDAVSLSFYDNSGGPLVVMTNLGGGSSFSLALGAGATQIVRLSPAGTVRTGYGVLTAPKGSSVRATVVFFYKPGSQPINQLGVQQVFLSNNFSFPVEVDLSRGVNTGLAICNPLQPTNGDVELAVSLIDEAGTLVNFRVVPLPTGRYLARFLSEQELFAGLQSFRGTVNVCSMRPFGLMALRSEQSSVGSITVTSSPVAGPFIQTGSVWPELEPNDSIEAPQAASLPTRIAAGFARTGDTDVFQFAGKKGDVVTALTQLVDQKIDPKLTLLAANGTVLLQNDQNGLLEQKDAFLQAVLPADGNYCVKVEEAGQKSSAELGYELHIRLLGHTSLTPEMVLDAGYPLRVVRGNTVNLELHGAGLCAAADVALLPANGISIFDVRASATLVNARLAISPTASLGSRWISVNYAGTVSNALPLEVVSSGTSAPRISNLQVGAPYTGSGHKLINFSFSFTDSDADIVYRASDLARSAKMLFLKTSGSKQCRMQMSNSLLNQSGKTSGSVTFALVADDYVETSSEVTLELIDAAGNISNALTFHPAIWQCGP